jgi:hypothetical protein
MGRGDRSRVEIEVVTCDAEGAVGAARHWVPVPDSVDPTEVEAFVVDRFGEPTDVALADAGALGAVVHGWVYPAAAGILQLAEVTGAAREASVLLVPFLRLPDGSRRQLFAHALELNHAFAGAVAPLWSGTIELDQLPPADRVRRLADEPCRFAGVRRDLVELQLRGWLTRMVEEGWTYLIVELPGTGRYVQFLTHDGDWLRGEAVGDRYLGGHAPLSDVERQALADAGWHAPLTRSDTSGNHWFEWIAALGGPVGPDEPPGRLGAADVADAARVATRTLLDAFGPIRADRVEVRTGTASPTDV